MLAPPIAILAAAQSVRTDASATPSSSASTSSISTRTVSKNSSAWLGADSLGLVSGISGLERGNLGCQSSSRSPGIWLMRSCGTSPSLREAVRTRLRWSGPGRRFRAVLRRETAPLSVARNAKCAATRSFPRSPLSSSSTPCAKPLEELARFDSEISVLVLRHSLCTRSRLDEPGQLARQPAELRRSLKRLVRACFGFLGGLGDV